MDYIIIALWGIVTGGIFWGSTLRNADLPSPQVPSKEQTVVQTQAPVQDVAASSPVIEQPLVSTAPKKHSGQSKPVAYTKSSPEPTPEVVPVAAAPAATEPVTPTEQNVALSFANVKEDKTTTKSAAPAKRKAISFTNQKPEDEAVIDVPIVDVPLADAPVAEHDTVIVFRIVTDEGDLHFTSQDVDPVAITEPLFDEAPVQPKPYKQSGLQLPGQLTVEQLMCDTDGKPLVHTLQRGETLTQISQRYFSDSRFWPYVFEVNRHQLSSPDKIQADMKLYLPDPSFYGIDVNDPASLEKSKELISKYLK